MTGHIKQKSNPKCSSSLVGRENHNSSSLDFGRRNERLPHHQENNTTKFPSNRIFIDIFEFRFGKSNIQSLMIVEKGF